RRRYPDDREFDAGKSNRLANAIRIAAKALPPETRAEDGHGLAIIIWTNEAADQWRNSQHREVRWGDPLREDGFGRAISDAHIHGRRPERKSSGEDVVVIAPRLAPLSISMSCSGWLTGSERSITASMSEKIAVFAPMPRARVRIAVRQKPGLLRSVRKA